MSQYTPNTPNWSDSSERSRYEPYWPDAPDRDDHDPYLPYEPSPTERDKSHAALCHLSALLSLVNVPLGNVVGPLICYLAMRGESAFVDDQSKEALNFNISLVFAYLIVGTLGSVLILASIFGFGSAAAASEPVFASLAFILFFSGVFVVLMGGIGLLWLVSLIFTIVAGVQASRGVTYRYPFTLRLLK